MPEPSGLKSSDVGQTKSFVRSPDFGPSCSHENVNGLPGLSTELMALSRSSPSSTRAPLRILFSVWMASVRMRASFGTAASTSLAPVAKVR